MSEHDGTDDPYRTPAPGSGPRPGPAWGHPGAGGPHPGQPYPGQPYPGQPYPGQPYPGQPYPGQPYPSPPTHPGQGSPGQTYLPGGVDPSRRPRVVDVLVQVMLAGAVAALLQGLYAAFIVDDLLAEVAGDLEQVAVDTGLDASSVVSGATTGFFVVLVLATAITVGLWLLFARLFARGSGRVVGTVLGAINGATLLFGLLAPDDLVAWLLTAVSAGLVVVGLVLLWRPATSAWFRAVAAARAGHAWG